MGLFFQEALRFDWDQESSYPEYRDLRPFSSSTRWILDRLIFEVFNLVITLMIDFRCNFVSFPAFINDFIRDVT